MEHQIDLFLVFVGGANIPALNDLLSPWDIAFSSEVLEGETVVADHKLHYASGTAIARFPDDGFLLARDLNHQGRHMVPVYNTCRVVLSHSLL